MKKDQLAALEDAHSLIEVVLHALLGIEQDRGLPCGAEIRLLERGVRELGEAIDVVRG